MSAEGKSSKRGTGRRKGPWAQAEIERLKRLYGLRPDTLIARDLQRSVESVRRMAKMVFAGEPRTGPWTADEVQHLKDYIGAAEVETIALILRRSSNEIRRKVEELQSEASTRPWTSEDVQVLKRLYGTREGEDLVLILGRPLEDVELKAKELCLAKDKRFRRARGAEQPTKMPRWTKDEVAQLERLYPTLPNLEIAKVLDRTVKSVVSKAHDLGLKKSPERLRTMGRENVSLRYKSREDEPPLAS